MKVIALVGASGTGKSYRAINLAHEKNIDYIIDDGLFIKRNKIIAGKSAKRQSTMVTAVKTALFTHKDHREEVRAAIQREQPKGILILGTSKKMVDKIALHLNIGNVEEYVYIEEISSEEERKIAKKQRHELGKHVIPVPTFEIKKDFSGYFIDPLKILRRKKDDTVQISEKSIVRPTFSYMGKYTISDKVISDLVNHAAKQLEGVHKISRVDIRNYSNGIVIDVEIIMVYGNDLRKLSRMVQDNIKEEVEYMTALNILAMNIYVKKIIII
ncbi:Asp23/Gls24 family envelope stress response protein [Crassaminicella thermophila]|uniref:Asp23/Gls24 family envelope stress response protein n=1 Tax=Crassaminicella thermophila TaxID=2599308 RepID=A0A5C0SFF3_CRATE|nr:Asp23/Gls24 family envelope stress response protein [Crassaminicella thermophila]QEK13101.1 Asp23/Gls24 family envelope stress response protein [Crassaminicella thermophila]